MSTLTFDIRGFSEVEQSLPRINARQVLAAGAAEYKAQWRAHFKALDAKGNRKGFAPKHFWIEEGYKKTGVAEITADFARVTCDSRAVLMRYWGGVIRPRDAGALAIPISAEAYAAGYPRNSGLPLEFIPIKNSRTPAVCGKLVEAAATRISYGKDGSVKKGRGNANRVGKTHYLIVWQVTIKPMGAAVKPDPGTANAAVMAKMNEAVGRQVTRANIKSDAKEIKADYRGLIS